MIKKKLFNQNSEDYVIDERKRHTWHMAIALLTLRYPSLLIDNDDENLDSLFPELSDNDDIVISPPSKQKVFKFFDSFKSIFSNSWVSNKIVAFLIAIIVL